MNFTCPQCQNQLHLHEEYDLMFFCSHPGFQIRYYPTIDQPQFISYQVDINLNNVEYGFDSSNVSNSTHLFIFDKSRAIHKAADIKAFTPFPKNKGDVEQHIQRLLNLKAFF